PGAEPGRGIATLLLPTKYGSRCSCVHYHLPEKVGILEIHHRDLDPVETTDPGQRGVARAAGLSGWRSHGRRGTGPGRPAGSGRRRPSRRSATGTTKLSRPPAIRPSSAVCDFLVQ